MSTSNQKKESSPEKNLNPSTHSASSHGVWSIGVRIAFGLLVVWFTIGIFDFVRRFTSDIPSAWSSFSIVTQLLIAFLAAGGVLTEAGQKFIQKAFRRPLPSTPVVIVMLLFLFFAPLLMWSNLPRIARYFNERGFESWEARELLQAKQQLERATHLDPSLSEAHYNLGNVYEDMLDIEQAQSAYQLAAVVNHLPAVNNLARLYIMDDRPDEAVQLLLPALNTFTSTSADPNADAFAVNERQRLHYTLWKNLGWARLMQVRDAEAQSTLQQAIFVGSELDPEPAAAHCLIAQVSDRLGAVEDAKKQWQLCIALSNPNVPEEDTWQGLYRQRGVGVEDEAKPVEEYIESP